MRRLCFSFFITPLLLFCFASCSDVSSSSGEETGSIVVTLPDTRAIVAYDSTVSDYSGGTYDIYLTGAGDTSYETSQTGLASGATVSFEGLPAGSYTVSGAYNHDGDCVAYGTASAEVTVGATTSVELEISLNKSSRIETLSLTYTSGDGNGFDSNSAIKSYFSSLRFTAVLSNGYTTSDVTWEEAALSTDDSGTQNTVAVTFSGSSVSDVDYTPLAYMMSSSVVEDIAGYSSIPMTLDLSSVTDTDLLSFAGADKLVSVTLPATLTDIGAECFSGCTSLESVVFTDTTKTWYAVKDSAYKEISANDISSPSAMATALTTTYVEYSLTTTAPATGTVSISVTLEE